MLKLIAVLYDMRMLYEKDNNLTTLFYKLKKKYIMINILFDGR